MKNFAMLCKTIQATHFFAQKKQNPYQFISIPNFMKYL